MENVLIYSTLLKVGLAIVALVTLRIVMRAMDRRTGTKLVDHMEIIDDNPMALAVYHGARLFALCYLLGHIIQ